jgi:hypothetical protein
MTFSCLYELAVRQSAGWHPGWRQPLKWIFTAGITGYNASCGIACACVAGGGPRWMAVPFGSACWGLLRYCGMGGPWGRLVRNGVA